MGGAALGGGGPGAGMRGVVGTGLRGGEERTGVARSLAALSSPLLSAPVSLPLTFRAQRPAHTHRRRAQAPLPPCPPATPGRKATPCPTGTAGAGRGGAGWGAWREQKKKIRKRPFGRRRGLSLPCARPCGGGHRPGHAGLSACLTNWTLQSMLRGRGCAWTWSPPRQPAVGALSVVWDKKKWGARDAAPHAGGEGGPPLSRPRPRAPAPRRLPCRPSPRDAPACAHPPLSLTQIRAGLG